MADNSEEKKIDIEAYRKSLNDIFSFENKERNKLKEIENSNGISQEEKSDIKQKLSEERNAVDIKRNAFIAAVAEADCAEMVEIVHLLKTINDEQKEYTQYIKRILTEYKVRNRVAALRKEDFAAMYNTIQLIDTYFKLNDYPMFTLKPQTPIYGSIVGKNDRSRTMLAPLTNDEIKSCLSVLVENDEKRFYDWVTSVLSFDESVMAEVFKEKYIEERQNLILWLIDTLKKDAKYKEIVSKKLFEGGDLARIFGFQPQLNKAKSEVQIKEEDVDRISKKCEEIEKSYQDRIGQQLERIQQLRAANENLISRTKKLDEIEERYNILNGKYTAQIRANEILVLTTDKQIEELNTKNNELVEETEHLKEELINTTALYENTKSDLSLRESEIDRLKEEAGKSEGKAKEKVLYELVNLINDQLYYLKMYNLELMENGTLEKDSMEMFGDTIKNIDEAFSSLGMQTYGEIDSICEYDSALHDSMGAKISNGDKVIIRRPGWKIGGTVYTKAQVEKEN